ncbi:MAG: hypothetical protein CL946_02380, partial [Ectothiorhodospiraceae bacterium]|nr:hypothetical protein [Ectothiorhodospiraceae bacterium]
PAPLEAGTLDPDISQWVMTLLEKKPQLRYRSALQVHKLAAKWLDRSLAIDGTVEETFVWELPAVNRTSQRTKILEALADKPKGFLGITIEGQDGIGKTSLLRDIHAELQIAGNRIITADGSERFAFANILELLRQVPLDADDEAQRNAAAVVNLFHPDSYPGIESASPTGMDADGEIIRLFQSCAFLLAGTPETTTVIFDDLHLASDLSQEFIGFFAAFCYANDLRSHQLILSYDPEQVAKEYIPEVLSEKRLSIVLPPLTKESVQRNLEGILGSDISSSFVSILFKQSGGVPGQILELLRFFESDGILERTEHGWIVHERENLAAYLPQTSEDAFARKIERLEEQSRKLLAIVGLSEFPIPISVLATVTGQDPVQLHSLLSGLQGTGLVDYSSGSARLGHASIAKFLPLKETEQTKLHNAFLAAYLDADLRADSEVLAYHALHGSSPKQAREYLIQAAEAAKSVYDYSRMIRHQKDLLKLLDSEQTEDDRKLRFQVLDSLFDAANVLGNRDDEQEYLEEMLILAGQLSEALPMARVYVNQSEHYLASAEFERARKSAEKALRYFEDAQDSLGIAQCKQRIGFIQYRMAPTDEVIEFYEDARKIFEECEEAIDEGNILIDIGLAYFSILNHPQKALQFFADAKRKYEEAGFARGIARAQGNAGLQYFLMGDYDTALARHQEANELFQKIGDYRATAIAHFNVGRCYSAMGKYTSALRSYDHALRIGKTLSDPYVTEKAATNIGLNLIFIGQYELALEEYGRAKKLAEQMQSTLDTATNNVDVAQIHVEMGETGAALKLLAEIDKTLDELKDVNLQSAAMFWKGQAMLRSGERSDIQTALKEFEELGAFADSNDLTDYRILARSYAAICHTLAGHPKEALTISEEAISLVDEQAYLLGGKQDIYLNHARVLRANKDKTRAEEFILKAYEEVSRIGEQLDDPEFYRSFTERVAVNADVIREHALLNRASTPESLSVMRDQNLRTLYGVAKKINSVLDLPQLLENIMDSALEAMNGERGMIFLIEDDELLLKVSRNVEKETIKDATEISLSILQDVISGGKPIIVSDTSQDEEIGKRESVVNYNIHSLICVPMRSKDELIGTVYVDSRSDALSAITFSQIDMEFLEAFANLATIAIENARLHTQLQEENLYLRSEVSKQFGFENIVGGSSAMEHLFKEMHGAISSDDSVLISGESGTGKELIARAIHYNGARKDKRFVAIDCGAVQDTLLESELFGYKRGAFTGAVSDKRGLFEEANNGTLFLDEIGNTSLAFQAKLLRVLQEGDFRRVGDTETRRVNVRIIAATNTNIIKEVEAGNFRQDLFYRLNVIPLRVPSLRDRLDDIPLLVDHFIAKYNEKNGSSYKGTSEELVKELQQRPWNGNVRELENIVNRMLVHAEGEMLTTKDIPSDLADSPSKSEGVRMTLPKQFQTLVDIEIEHIRRVLVHTENNKTEAAKILGLKRTTLVERMKKLNMM